jgi:hypothetical protein
MEMLGIRKADLLARIIPEILQNPEIKREFPRGKYSPLWQRNHIVPGYQYDKPLFKKLMNKGD